jgi:hypothetical protein
MLRSPTYFNRSIWDTISGEYFRSFKSKSDYFHIFDYWRWDEQVIDKTLASYSWETAPDTKTTWRIGDGTAAFYNYVYYTVAGFTEHDTFRSNQIREGQLSRDQALALSCLAAIKDAVNSGQNMMPTVIAAVEAKCTLGEISDVLRNLFGEYQA